MFYVELSSPLDLRAFLRMVLPVRVLAVSNQKGGVGKTTSAVNISAFLALSGRKTLLIDIDPQANASSIFAPDYDGPGLFHGAVPIQTQYAGLSLLPATPDLRAYENQFSHPTAQRQVLRDLLSRFDFDQVVIDCPPSFSPLTVLALQAAQVAVVPIQCEYYAMEGLGSLLANLNRLETEGVPAPPLRILLTMHDQLDNARLVEAEIRRHFPKDVFQNVIPRDPNLARAPAFSQTILGFSPLSPGALAYLAATKELLV